MNWHETIESIRHKPEYYTLIQQTYMDDKLTLNVERFKQSEEFRDTKDIVHKYAPNAKRLLDIGCGNGTSSIAWALEGYEVVAVEPDPSETVGAGAIRKLVEHYHLDHVTIHQAFAEEIGFEDGSFDIVYVRQAMHHAYDLAKFIKECSRVLKKGGLLLTIRDHVVFDEADKALFLEAHPLHKFYGGENAFTEEEYTKAMADSGLTVRETLRFFDSEINFFPLSSTVINKAKQRKRLALAISRFLPLKALRQKVAGWLNERDYPGRMYSFISIKS